LKCENFEVIIRKHEKGKRVSEFSTRSYNCSGVDDYVAKMFLISVDITAV